MDAAIAKSLAREYWANGFIDDISLLNADEVARHRSHIEEAERVLGHSLHYVNKVHTVLRSAYELATAPTLVNQVEEILGPDILLYNVTYIIKEPGSSKFVSFHQDLTYWRLNDIKEVTSLFAVSSAQKEAGCMKFIPGSHKNRIIPHIDTFDKNNMLSRGQEISVEVDEEQAVYAELNAGQASFHHGLLFHSSGPNTTKDRRIGSAIRYISASMKQETGDRPIVTQVSGNNDFGNFKILPPPKGRLLEEEFELCRLDNELKKKLLL